MNINTRDLEFVNFTDKNGNEYKDLAFVNFNNVIVYEAWKELTKSGVPPITLQKCKGKPVRLPGEYQQVEYIETTGEETLSTEYVDKPGTRIELDFIYTSIYKGNTETYYIGANAGNLLTISSDGYMNIAGNSDKDILAIPNTRYNVVLERDASGLRTGIINGIEKTGTKNTAAINKFFLTELGGSTSSSKICGKIYSCKIYENDVLVRDMIPCYRKSDNVIGMYDLVNNVFYTNAGTGTFLKGKNVLTGVDLVDYKIYGDSKQELLPSEYQQVEYIESTGTQYIDMQYAYKINDKINIDFMKTKDTGALQGIFGNGNLPSYTGTSLYMPANNTLSATIGGRLGAEFYNYSTPLEYNKKYKIEINTNKIYLDDELIITATNTLVDGTQQDFSLFRRWGTNTFCGRIYKFNVIRNGEYLFNMIPCYRISDNVIGMYDLVNDVFYTNAGTETFLKGSNAPTPDAPIEVESVGDYDETIGKYKIPVKTMGKNLIPINSFESNSIWGTKLIDMETLLKTLKPGIKYVISADFICEKVPENVSAFVFGYLFVGKEKESLYLSDSYEMSLNETKHLSKSFTLPVDTTKDSYHGIYLYMNYSSTAASGCGGRVENIQIEVERETDFVPYVESVITDIYLDEPLRKITSKNYDLTFQDYIDFENQKVVRNIYSETIKEIYNKSSVFIKYAMFLAEISKKPKMINVNQNGFAISNKFKQHDGQYGQLPSNDNSIQSYITSAEANRVAFTFDETITTVEQAQEKIGDGFEVCYALETPIEETIELPNIPTHKGTTIIDVDTELLPSNMEVKYYGKE